MSSTRSVEVAPERLAGWVQRFVGSHGEVTRSIVEHHDAAASPSSSLRLDAADGSWATLTGWRGAVAGEELAAFAAAPPLLVLLVRRGGYAVALVDVHGTLVRHKVGTRHVQSRTAAGGWSQQRYARRRSNQADALVEAVVGHTVRVLEEGGLRPQGVVLGGDRTLAAETVQGVGTGERAGLTRLPRRELWDLSDPRRVVLDGAVLRGRAVRVEVHNA